MLTRSASAKGRTRVESTCRHHLADGGRIGLSEPQSVSMSLLTEPVMEGTITVRQGRKLGFAEFGGGGSRTVVWLHGTPGARRQIPESVRRAAPGLDVRVIGIDRPGVGLSTPHLYGSVLDFTTDLVIVLDRLDLEQLAVAGLSGGGPYALAAGHAFPDRVAAVGVLGGLVPTCGGDGIRGGLLGLATRFAPILPALQIPASVALSTFVRVLRPLGPQVLNLYAHFSPEGDRRILQEPEFKTMFLDDLVGNSRRGLRGPVFDVILFTRPWGFSLKDVEVPVGWWHGDSDPFVPLDHARQAVSRIPKSELTVRPGESHLGGMAAAGEVLAWLLSWCDPATTRAG